MDDGNEVAAKSPFIDPTPIDNHRGQREMLWKFTIYEKTGYDDILYPTKRSINFIADK